MGNQVEYICQIQEGWMLCRNKDKDTLFLHHTGYPYPDTRETNFLMMMYLVYEKLNIRHSENWYVLRWIDFRDFCMSCIKQNKYDVDIRDIYKAFVGNNSCEYDMEMAEFKGGIYRLPDLASKYISLYVHNLIAVPDYNDFVEILLVVYPFITELATGDKSGIIFINKEMFFKHNEDYQQYLKYEKEHINKSSKVDTMISDKLLELIEISYEDLSTIIQSTNDVVRKKIILTNPFILDEDGGETFRRLLLDKFIYSNLADVYNRFLIYFAEKEYSVPNIREILDVSIQKGKDSGKIPVYIYHNCSSGFFLSTLHYAMQLDRGEELSIDFSTSSISYALRKSVEDMLASYWRISTKRYDEKRRSWIVTPPEGVSEGCYDSLSKIAVMSVQYEAEIVGFLPDIVTSNEVVWDFTKHFDEKLSRIAVYILLSLDYIAYDSIVDIDELRQEEYMSELLDCVYNRNDLAFASVFDYESVSKYKLALKSTIAYISGETGGYFKNLPKELEEILGEFNLFAKLLLSSHSYAEGCRSTESYGKNNIVIRRSTDGHDEFVLEYTLSVWNVANINLTTNISEESFKYISGALLFDFLVSLIKYRDYLNVYDSCSIQYFSFDNLSISFTEELQFVTIKYRVD